MTARFRKSFVPLFAKLSVGLIFAVVSHRRILNYLPLIQQCL